MPNRRVFSEGDLEALAGILQKKLDENKGHACVFTESSAAALKEFSKQIEDPEVRQGIISMSKAWNETGTSVRRWLVKGFIICSMFGLLYLGWDKVSPFFKKP